MLTKKQQFWFVLAIPIINVFADSTQGYTSKGFISPGNIRAFFILLFIILFFKTYYRKNRINNTMLFSLIYYFILVLFASEFSASFSVYTKFFIASMMLPISYYYFNSFEKFSKLLKVFGWLLGVYLFFFLIANIFGLGSSDYLEDSVYFGAGRVNMTKTMGLIILIYPLLLRLKLTKWEKRIFILFMLIGLVVIFIGVKRSAILGLLVGYLIYFLLTPYKVRFSKAIIVFGIIITLFSPLFLETALDRFQARKEGGRFDLETEQETGRMTEVKMVLDAFKKENTFFKLFGAEIFNGKYYFGVTRMLHTDYMTMLHGTGIVGFFFFLYIYYLIFKKTMIYRKHWKNNKLVQDISAVSIALLFSMLIFGYAGAVHGITMRSIVFLFWGGFFSIAQNENLFLAKDVLVDKTS